MLDQELRTNIETVRNKISARIDQLIKHEKEYYAEGDFDRSVVCDQKSRLLKMVLDDIDSALGVPPSN
jgi:hypothetical protein